MAEQAQSQRPREPVEQLAPTAPERPIPPWLILPEALLAGVALVAILVSQTNLVARGELEQALDQAFERGFAAAADIERSIGMPTPNSDEELRSQRIIARLHESGAVPAK